MARKVFLFLLFACKCLWILSTRSQRLIECLKMCAITAAICILLALSATADSAGAGSGERIPHLEYDNRMTYFLASGEAWRPSGHTLVTALMPNKPLTLQLNPARYDTDKSWSAVNTTPFILLFKCSTSEKHYTKRLVLTTNQIMTPSTHCIAESPFTFVSLHGSSNMFNITLQKSTVQFDRAMNHLLEFRVRMLFYEGTAESASLFVHNLDGLAKMNPTPTLVSGIPFTKYILTDEAIRFFLTLSTTQTVDVQTLQLLDNQFVQAVMRTSLLIRTIMSVSVLIRVGKLCSDDLQTSNNDIIFTSGDPHRVIVASIASVQTSHIHIQKGKLTFSANALATQRSRLTSYSRSSPIRVCLRVSLNAPVWDYHLTLTVTDQLTNRQFPLATSLPASPCHPVNHRSRWVILTEGMRDVLLYSPIICSDMSTEAAVVSLNGKTCDNLIAGSRNMWQSCDSYNISQKGNAVWLTGSIKPSHAGSYAFALGGVRFTYLITVLSLPLFITESGNGALPHVTYANLDSQVSFTCRVYHDGVTHVLLEPIFRVLERFGPATWRDINIDDFALQILKTAPSFIDRSDSIPRKNSKYTGLKIKLPLVVPSWNNWALIFTCRATLISTFAERMGLPHYVVETSTDVTYFGIRLTSGQGVAASAAPVLSVSLLAMSIFSFYYVRFT